MGYIYNASNDTIDLIIVSADLKPIKNESSSNLLNGNWFIQSIGTKAEMIDIVVICSWEVFQELRNYDDTKEQLTVEYLDFEKSGCIISRPDGSVYTKGGTTERKYQVAFSLAVIPNV